jgi:auxin efflux carrier family protein
MERPDHSFGDYHSNRRSPSQGLNGRDSRRRHSAHIFYSFPSTPYLPTAQFPINSDASSVYESDMDSDDDELRIPVWSRPPTFLQRVRRSACTVWKKVTDFMSPPLWASLVSLLVALNPPLQHVLEVHMQPVQEAITQAGNCSIPITLVVLGAYFHRPPEQQLQLTPSSTRSWGSASFASSMREIFRLKGREEDRRSYATQRVRTGEGRTIFVAILARMVVVPALFLPLIVMGAIQDHPPVFKE